MQELDQYKQAIATIERILCDYKDQLDASMCSNVADYMNSYLYEHRDEWSVQGNAMGLVYMPDKVALRGV